MVRPAEEAENGSPLAVLAALGAGGTVPEVRQLVTEDGPFPVAGVSDPPRDGLVSTSGWTLVSPETRMEPCPALCPGSAEASTTPAVMSLPPQNPQWELLSLVPQVQGPADTARSPV